MKIVEIIELIFLERFANFFGGYTDSYNIIDKLNINLIIKKNTQILKNIDFNCGIAEKIILNTFIEIFNYNLYDTALLIDCILEITRIYISEESTKFIHGNISKLIN